MDKKELLEIYKIVVEEEHYFLKEHQNRISFYVGILTALIGGIIAGFFYSEKWFHFALLMLGAIAMIYICKIAKLGTKRMYQRFLEVITMRAKVEHHLGMASSDKTENSKSWVEIEPLVTKRHLENRADCRTSKDWVNKYLKESKNYHGTTTKLLDFTKIIGIFLGVLSVIFVVSSLCPKLLTCLFSCLSLK